MKFIRRILVLLCCLSSVLNCVPAIATEVHDGFNLYQQRFGSYYSIHDILKKKLLCDELVERAESTVQTFEWVTTIGETTIYLQEAVSDGFQTILHFKISASEENAIIRPAFLYFDIYDPYYTQLEEYSEIVYFVEYDFLALSNHSISTNYYGTSNNEREMDYIVVLDNEDEPNIETFREQCIFSVIRYDPDTKKATTQKTESMPIEVQIPSSITYYTICQDSSGKEGVQNDLGEWIIPPIYDEVSYDGNVYWVFIERNDNEQKLVGIIDTSQGFAIAAHYDEILIGDSLIVAYDPLTHVYDIFDRQCRLIYTLPGKYDYVVPNGECCVDVVDLDAGIYTIKIPSYLITNY